VRRNKTEEIMKFSKNLALGLGLAFTVSITGCSDNSDQAQGAASSGGIRVIPPAATPVAVPKAIRPSPIPIAGTGTSAPDLNQRLIELVNNDDFPGVRTAIRSGADIEALDDGKNTPLMTAIKNGNLPMIRFLLNSGANFAAENQVGSNPFSLADELGSPQIRGLLDENYRETQTALFKAIDELRFSDAAALIKRRGLRPEDELEGHGKVTAVDFAIQKYTQTDFEKVDQKSKELQNFIHDAMTQVKAPADRWEIGMRNIGRLKNYPIFTDCILIALVKEIRPQNPDQAKAPFLVDVVDYLPNSSLLSFLEVAAASGFDMNSVNDDNSILTRAIQDSSETAPLQEEAIDFLLSHGANVNARDPHGSTALDALLHDFLASDRVSDLKTFESIFDYFCKKGAHPNEINIFRAPWFDTLKNLSPELVRFLTSKGVHFDHTESGETATR
jgi:hypothetical protein